MKGTLLTLTLCTAMILGSTLMGSDLKAQSSSAPAEYIVELEGLTPELYAKAVRQTRTTTDMVIAESCVPASLLVVRVERKGRTEEQLRAYIVSTLANSTLLTVEVQTNLSYEAFQNACRQKRLGN